MGDEAELQEAIGYTYTHVDCPECQYDMQWEGTITGPVECEECGKHFLIRTVM